MGGGERHRQVCLYAPELLAVRIFKVALLPQPGQDGPSFPLQAHQSAVLQDVLHQSPLLRHALLHCLLQKVMTSRSLTLLNYAAPASV